MGLFDRKGREEAKAFRDEHKDIYHGGTGDTEVRRKS